METEKRNVTELSYDFGTFEGFNFRHQSAILCNVSGQDVVNWDHDTKGEAEFWPAGDCEGVSLVFKNQNAVSSSELIALDNLLNDLGGDSKENFILIHYAINLGNYALQDLSSSDITDDAPTIFSGSNFIDVRKEAAYELFELYYPEAYKSWESSNCDGLIFDTDRFLASPGWSVDEVEIGREVYLLVKPQ